PYPAPRGVTYGIQRIAVDNKIQPASPEAWDVGREPEAVMFIADAQFGRRRDKSRVAEIERARRTFLPLGAPLMPGAAAVNRVYLRVAGFLLDNAFDYAVTDADLQRVDPPSGAVRAYFLEDPLKNGQRTTLFGFTSDQPPTFEDVEAAGESAPSIDKEKDKE